jgi:hypothetical protein
MSRRGRTLACAVAATLLAAATQAARLPVPPRPPATRRMPLPVPPLPPRTPPAHVAALPIPPLPPYNWLGPAPVPDLDARAPAVPDAAGLSARPALFHLQRTVTGDGYPYGASLQEQDDRRALRVPGVRLTLPLP